MHSDIKPAIEVFMPVARFGLYEGLKFYYGEPFFINASGDPLGTPLGTPPAINDTRPP